MDQSPHLTGAVAPAEPRRRTVWLVAGLVALGGLLFSAQILYHLFGHRTYVIHSASMEPTLVAAVGEDPNSYDRVRAELLLSRFREPRRGEVWVFRPPEEVSTGNPFIYRVVGLPGETVEVVPPRLLLDGRELLTLTAAPGAILPLQMREPPQILQGGRAAVLFLEYQREPLRVVLLADLEEGVFEGPEEIEPLIEAVSTDVPEALLVFQNGEPREVRAQGNRLEYQVGQVLIDGTPLNEPYVASPPAYAMEPLTLGPEEYALFGDNRNSANDSHVWGAVSRDRLVGHARYRFWPRERAGHL
jgi:signal peptidase I